MRKTFITGIAKCDFVALIASFFTNVVSRPLALCANGVQDLPNVMQWYDVGVDPYFPVYQDAIIELFPDARWIIIDAPISDQDIGSEIDPAFVKEKLEYLASKVNAIRINLHGPDHDNGINEIKALAEQLEPMQETPNNLKMQELLREMCSTQPEAYEVLTEMWTFALLIDHVYDGDGVRRATILRSLKSMFIKLGLNPFYQKNCAAISLAFVPIIAAWEHSNVAGVSKVWAIQLYASLPSLFAYIIGGQSHVDYYMPKIHMLLDKGLEEDELRDNRKK